ncbi:3'-5' exonuclease [Deferrisoma camini]|uniref:3'-5' exonuclease n=1 Tax=Deferrisoma camini TaxID=1035120 RepID=UPI00046C9F31|nr:3'-5' exonuclease [Deferrisoma camini]
MATMIPEIPEGVEAFHTEGERRFYRFLQQVARPDREFVAWYTPDVGGREPDFVLFHPDLGLVVFEVKDWALHQIRRANPHGWVIEVTGREEARPNPLRQAREYKNQILERLRRERPLCLANDPHKVKVPVAAGVVFANINRHEYEEKGLDRVIPSGLSFFWDDLHPQGDLFTDPSGRKFRERLEASFRPLFPCRLTGREQGRVRQVRFPEVRIPAVRPPAPGEDRERLRLLDHNQESLARRWDGGHRIVAGPSGCGKTLVLVHRARFLRKYNPKVQRVLLVCYNVALVPYLKRLCVRQGLGLGPGGGVEVCHVFELCQRVVGEPVAFEKEEPGYYDLVVEEALGRLAEFPERYDAVLVDEGQDFSDAMLRLVVGLLNPDTDHLLIALDEHQDLYRRGGRARWSDLGIRARGRVHRLRTAYRSTEELAGFAGRFRGLETSAEPSPGATQLELFSGYLTAPGPDPALVRLPDPKAVVAFVAEAVAERVLKRGVPASEVAVLYPTKRPYDPEGPPLPKRLEQELLARGVLARWAAEDYRSKAGHDITIDSVTISTVHTAKGMDWSVVFVVGLDALEPGNRWSKEQLKNLAYVAITRARYELVVPYVTENGLVRRLRRSLG